MSLAGTLDVSVRSMLWYSQRLRFLRECHSLAHMMFQIGRCFDKVKVWGSQGMSLAGTLDVPARSMLRHSQGLRFLRECRTPVDLMFQLGQCFKTVKAWGSSGNVAHRHTWCFSEVNASTQSKFEVTQGMSLGGTLDVSARSMLQHSQSLTFLGECCSPAQLIFEQGLIFDTVKVWGFSGNVACRHIWCFSKFNASTQSKFEVTLGMSLAGTPDISAWSMFLHMIAQNVWLK